MGLLRKEQVAATLMNLQNVGISEHEIAELIKLVDMWNRLPGTGVNIFGQGNGGGSSTSGLSKLGDRLIRH